MVSGFELCGLHCTINSALLECGYYSRAASMQVIADLGACRGDVRGVAPLHCDACTLATSC